MAATKNDAIMEALIGAGYNTGTISDRERQRLLAVAPALTVLQGERYSLDDLYVRANEKPRLY